MLLRERWQHFARPPVGQRFQRRYHDNHGGQLQWFTKPIILLVGTLIMLAGLMMLIAPGPGFLAFFLGAILLAQESLWVARLLDGCDLRGRRLSRAIQARWQSTGTGLRILIVLGVLAALAGLAGLAIWAGFIQILAQDS